MTARPNHSIDGFTPRRPGAPLERNRSSVKESDTRTGLTAKTAERSSGKGGESLEYSSGQGLSRHDIRESLKDLSNDEPKKKTKKRSPRSGRRLSFRKLIKWVTIVALVILIGVGGWIGWRALVASGSIFKGNALGLMRATPLKQDTHGRSNVLVLGTSEDEPDHDGAYLTDSMMVLSANQEKGTAAMFSIPRDLYVDYGRVCNSGSQGKINEYFNCVNSDWSDPLAEEERMDQTRKFVGDIFGLDIQYVVHINNTVLKDAVDAIGGIRVDIQGSGGAPGILDRNFDWRCNYQCHYVKYDNGVHSLDGEHALYLAMARGSVAPTYGLGNSNFDREKNQQKIMLAIRDKAVSAGTLTNISHVTGLIEALGSNLRTNFDTSEIRTLMNLGADSKAENIQRIDLMGDDNKLFAVDNYGGASVVVPASGAFQYDAIRDYISRNLSSDPVVREAANITVLNGSGVPGAAQEAADKLSSQGFLVGYVGNAPTSDYTSTKVYKNPESRVRATRAKLESVYNTKVSTDYPVPFGDGVDFVVVVGSSGGSD